MTTSMAFRSQQLNDKQNINPIVSTKPYGEATLTMVLESVLIIGLVRPVGQFELSEKPK
jgi:hypothetical protein